MQYPTAYNRYAAFCKSHLRVPEIIDLGEEAGDIRYAQRPLGSALLIHPPPPPTAGAAATTTATQGAKPIKKKRTEGKKHYVACLFTSYGFGSRGLAPPEDVLIYTRFAMRDLLQQVRELRERGETGKVYMCRFNSGLFRVNWEDTRAVVESVAREMDFDEEMFVVVPE